jgi:hypothetical protein
MLQSQAVVVSETQPQPNAERPRKGMRGAAPWTQRHMCKQMAEEQKHREVLPPPPGSARASLRTPRDVDDIAYQIELLHSALARIRGHKRTVSVTFWEVGQILEEIADFRLYAAKGYASLAHMLEREDLPWDKATCLAIFRLKNVIRADVAKQIGIVRAFDLLKVLEAQ